MNKELIESWRSVLLSVDNQIKNLIRQKECLENVIAEFSEPVNMPPPEVKKENNISYQKADKNLPGLSAGYKQVVRSEEKKKVKVNSDGQIKFGTYLHNIFKCQTG